MPNLKNALLAQQHGAARHATIRKAEEHRKSKASSVKASVTGTKVAAKRARKSALLPPADTTSGFKSKGKGKAKVQSPTIPFARDDTILLLGEANFSYAISLIQEPHNHPPHLLCATSYDSEEVCFKKYGDGAGNVKVLRERGVKVGFEVDAGDLDGKGGRGVIGKGRRWSRVIFNFPHVGAGIKDQDRNVLSNQQLILRTLRSVHPILTEGPPLDIQSLNRKRKRQLQDDDSDHERSPSPSLYLEDDIEDSQPIPIPSTFTPPNRQGSLLITLLNQNPYTLWNLPKLATKPPPPPPSHSATQTEKPQPKYKLIRSFEFRPEVYPGYAHRRTIGFKEGLSKGDNEEIKGRKGAARTWEFVGVETPAEKGYGE